MRTRNETFWGLLHARFLLIAAPLVCVCAILSHILRPANRPVFDRALGTLSTTDNRAVIALSPVNAASAAQAYRNSASLGSAGYRLLSASRSSLSRACTSLGSSVRSWA